MRHRYECPLRWADLDLLGHVNNVVYVDYLQEARVDMMRTHGARATERLAGLDGVSDSASDQSREGVVVVRHEVSYLEPLTFRLRPISIECWVTEIRAASFTMAYEIFDETEEGRTVHLRASTVLAPYDLARQAPRRLTAAESDVLRDFLEDGPPAAERIGPIEAWEPGHFPLHVRFSDVDMYGHVNNVKYFEYLQEARIPLMSRIAEPLADLGEVHVVVAQTDVDYQAPILLRREPYGVQSRLARVGSRSFTIESEIRDGDRTLARGRVVLVFIDPATGRSAEPPAAYRDAMLAVIEQQVTRAC